MAPHDGDLSLCTDDLQSLFELAQELFGVHSTSLIQSSEQDLVREGKRGRRKEGESDGGKGGWEEWREREGEGRKEGESGKRRRQTFILHAHTLTGTTLMVASHSLLPPPCHLPPP